MNFMDIQGNSLIISITLTLIVGAIIVYYLNSKIVTLEKTVARQNTVLADFVKNIRNEIAGPSLSIPSDISGPASHDATLEAKQSAETFMNAPRQRIDVSDDSESESDSDSDAESDGENEAPQVGVSEEVKIIDLNSQSKESIITEIVSGVDVIEVGDANKNDDAIKLGEAVSIGETIKTISLLNKDDIDSLKVQSDSDIDSDSDDDSDDEDQTHADVSDTHADVSAETPKDAEESKDISLQNVDVLPEVVSGSLDVHQLFTKHLESSVNLAEDTNISYHKLKVDELRKMAIETNLGSEDDISKMKKKDLVALFNK
tara:strand:- start:1551 stop:2498 length:948 start_codon:yes stop_codon:yes gene_type:complete